MDLGPEGDRYRDRGRHYPGGGRRRNALFGGAGFRRYDGDYDEQWW